METFDFRLTTTATVLDICLVQVASMLYKRIQNEITAVKDTENAKWEDGLKKQRRQHKTDHTALYQMYVLRYKYGSNHIHTIPTVCQ
jgi:hypothetical protein